MSHLPQTPSRPLRSGEARNPNHHIWCNNGTYFVHLTVVWKERKKVRLRKSLRTKDMGEARRRRDRFIARLGRQPELQLLIRSRGRPVAAIGARAVGRAG